MIGWGFNIYKQKGDNTMPASATSEQGECLAAWNAELGGLDWLEELVNQQKSICLQAGFYPGLYTAQAKNMLPLLLEEPPFVREGLDWTDKENPLRYPIFNKSEQAIRATSPDEWLIIEVWDLS